MRARGLAAGHDYPVLRAAAIGLLLAGSATPAISQVAQAEDALWQAFVDPPAEAKPMMRWWRFGPSVVPGELDREIRAMKAAGFGGFEVQPVYPLSLDGAPAGLRNLPYLSDGFIEALRHAARTAHAENMRIDVTAGSGWPFGGPHIWLKPGTNHIEGAVSNTALNLLSGRAAPDYRLLHLRYGERFQPQDMDGVAPQPSGLLQPPTLIEAPRSSAPCGG